MSYFNLISIKERNKTQLRFVIYKYTASISNDRRKAAELPEVCQLNKLQVMYNVLVFIVTFVLSQIVTTRLNVNPRPGLYWNPLHLRSEFVARKKCKSC